MNDPRNDRPPAKRTFGATLSAMAVAAVILVAVIWPDRKVEAPGQTAEQATPVSQAEADGAPPPSDEDDLAALIEGNIRDAEPGTQKSYDAAFRSERVEVPLGPFEEVELKAHMKPGDTIVYAWTSPRPMYVDLHGEPYTYPEEPAVRYEERDGVQSGNGRITATFEGMNGWYWMNLSEEPAVIDLQVSGFYESMEEVFRSGPK